MTPSSGPRILIVEDDISVRQTLVDMVEFNGYTPIAASNGVDGLAIARRDLPALVLTDIAMPGMTGSQMLEAMRKDEALRTIPVIVLSAKVARADTRHSMALGAEDYITKPFTEDEVIRSIQARLEKKALYDELDAFAHTVAHDLKNPLTLLLGRAELLEMTWGSCDDATKLLHIQEIIVAGRRLSRIIDELLVLAGVRRQTVKPCPVDMAPVVTEALGRVEHHIAQTHAAIVQPKSWPVAMGYAPWIAEIWVNYVSNALKYGGSPAQVTLGADPAADGKVVRFWVEDHGPGIDPSLQGRLFVPFSRISGTRAQGSGLGLSIVRRIAERLDGRVGVDSQPGAGTRFWFELPAVQESALPSPPSQ